jgi:hypothetical protein
MLTISIDNDGRLLATQRGSSPTVYLDHWALRELSTTPVLAERFVVALKQRNDTLALSYTNLLEFCNAVISHSCCSTVWRAARRRRSIPQGAAPLPRASLSLTRRRS